MIKTSSLFSLALTAALLMTGCSQKRFTDVADVRNFSQNPLDYIQQEEKKVPGEFLTEQEIRDDFDQRYFIPWSLKEPPYKVEQIKWPWSSYTPQNSFKENKRPIDDGWFKLMLLEANFDEYGKVSKPGIVIRTSSIRNFPSYKPVFKDFADAGEGYPFDYNQNSVTTSNEPVLISHYSKTKEWVYVITNYTSGWLPTHDVAQIAPDIIQKWSQARQATLLEDDMPLYDLDQNFVTNSRIGMMLPIMKVEHDSYQAILATSKSDDFVTFSIVRIPKSASVSEPIPLNTQAIAIMANAFMGKAYGWGGVYENRDCSSTLRDMFKPFHLWLPRNSKEQAQVGRIYDLGNLKNKQKERVIIENAVPFQTLLYKPGHVMLYIGEVKGKAMVLHNIWGITTKSKSKAVRNVIGRTIISTLQVGKEVKNFVRNSALINKITSMNVITMRPTEQPIVIKPKKVKRKSARERRLEAKALKEKKKQEAEAAQQSVENQAIDSVGSQADEALQKADQATTLPQSDSTTTTTTSEQK